MKLKECPYFINGICHQYNEENPSESYINKCFLYNLKNEASQWNIDNCDVRKTLDKIVGVEE